MLTKDVRFDGWTTEDWSRLLSLLKSAPEAEPRAPQGGLLLLHAGGKIRKLLHTTRGRIEKDGETWPSPLSTLAARHEARWVVAAPLGGLEKIAERFGARSRPGDDLTSHARKLLSIVRELSSEGVLEIWPNHLDRMALPSRPLFDNMFEALYPEGHALLFAIFHQGELFTSIALVRGTGGVRRIAGPDELRRHLSFLSGDFRRDYRFALAAAEDTIGPVAIGCFTELSMFQQLRAQNSWAAWLRALAVRDVIVTPMNAALMGPFVRDATVWAGAAADALGKRSETLGLLLSLWQKWR